jgi:DNA-binding LacI/PurR family transcriptional regulator/serine phosphatase RsbU (regulator of sigma subunit)
MHGSGRSNGRVTLGLLVDWFKEPYQNAVFSAIARACVENDANLLCVTGGPLEPNDPFWSQRNVLYDFIGPHNVDGLVVMGSNIGTFVGPQRLRQYLTRFAPVKSVCIAYGLEGTPSVLVDNRIGLRELVEHLIIIHHCRHIAFIRGPSANAEAEQRYAVYREVLQNHGVNFDATLVAQGDFNRLSGIACARELLNRRVKIDGLVAANDLMALGAMEVLESSGIRIPDDIAVVGFDDVDEARLAIPQLTTVRQPFHVLGREAVRAALAQVRGETVADVIAVPSQVVIRRSCGCRANSWGETESESSSITPEAARADIETRFHNGFAALASEGITVDEATAMQLFKAVFDELDGKCVGQFAAKLAEVIRPATMDGLELWSRVMAIMFRALHGWTAGSAERRRRSDGIRQQVHALVGDLAELTQGQQRVRMQRLMLDLSEASRALITAGSMNELTRALAEHLPILRVPACSLSFYSDSAAPHRSARLEFAYDARRPEVSQRAGESFDPRQLAPSGLHFDRVRETIVLEPLFFEHEQLGLLNLALGPEEGVVYESIRDHVSAAVRSLALVEKLGNDAKQRLELEKEYVAKERQAAADIQTMLLPRQYAVKGLEIVAVMRPAANAGGDYYDVLPTPDGCWLGVGDVVGHGLQSSLITLMLQSAVSGLVKSGRVQTPRDLINSTNAMLFENVRKRLNHDDHVTLCLLKYTTDGRLQFAGAHEELLVHRSRTGRCERHLPNGIWSGIVPDVLNVTTDQELRLEKDDLLILYTDGVVAARDVRGQFFGLERLIAEIELLASRPTAEISSQLMHTIETWMPTQQDDLTLLVARYTG